MGFQGNTRESLAPLAKDVFTVPEFLVEHMRRTVIERFGERVTMQKNKGRFIYFQEYDPPALIETPVPLVEGSPPDPKQLTKRTITGQLVQFGNFMSETDVLLDINEDGTASLRSGQARFLGELSSMERARHCILTLEGGTNKYYANGSAVVDVNTAVSRSLIEEVLEAFDFTSDGLHAEEITEIIKTDQAFGTVSILPAFVVIIHPDLRYDFEQLAGWKDISDYPGGTSMLPGEIGSVGRFRVCRDDYISKKKDAGAAIAGKNVKSTTGTSADIYPMIFLSKNAFKVVPLQGEEGAQLIVHMVGSSGASDALNQFGTVGYKNWGTAVPTHNHRYAIGYVAATDVRS